VLAYGTDEFDILEFLLATPAAVSVATAMRIQTFAHRAGDVALVRRAQLLELSLADAPGD
jgi:uncharacterized protein (DUF2252 family)